MSTRFSSADAAWLHMDRPTNLMVINSVMLFDRPVDWSRTREIIQHRLIDRYPKFRQRVVESHLPLRPPRWEEDPDFDLEHHMHHLALPAPGDTAALQELVGDLMTMPLDHTRPLWHTYMVDGFGDGAALISRMHHCIADGIALARVMLSLTDSAPDAAVAAPEPARHPRRRSGGVVGSAAAAGAAVLGGAARIGVSAARQGIEITTSPAHAARLAGAVARDGGTALRLLLTPADAATALKGDPGISRRVAWTSPLSLAEIKRTAHRHDATVNDVLLAAVSGALRHYLQARGGPVGEVQAMVPFNLRPLDAPIPTELGNRFGLVFLPLPVATSGSYRRLVAVHRRMSEIKQGRDGPVSYGLLSLTGMTPEPIERRIIDLFTAKGTAVMTNVPGPREPVYFAGVPVQGVLIWAPTSGHIGMSVSIFSYCGEVTIGLMVDAAMIPDPGDIVDQIEQELQSLGRLDRQGHVRRRRSPRRPRRQDGRAPAATHQRQPNAPPSA
ncbi:MAG TPA: wax ester/triacylglycerol synthase family O-acyltransferase [Solirubrobacteraceae bacterium]